MSKIIDEIIEREGRVYTNDPDDSGGPTKFGITQKTLSAWRGYEVTPEEVEGLEESEARDIYTHEYVTKPNFDKIEWEGLRDLIIDGGVHSGQKTSAKWLQEATGVTVDGMVGPMTLGAVNRNPVGIFWRVISLRRKHFRDLAKKRSKDLKYLWGWNNRLDEIIFTYFSPRI